jgi:hypothetical protein
MVDILDYAYALKGDDLKIWFADRGFSAYFEGTFADGKKANQLGTHE